MIRLIVLAALLVWPALACAQSAAPPTYKNAAGQYAATVMASPICGASSSGAPASCQAGNTAPLAYKNAAGQWQSLLPIAPVCSLDVNGHPQACQFGGGSSAATYANPTPATITQPASGSAPSGATPISATLTQVSQCNATTQPLQLPAGASSGVTTFTVVNSGTTQCAVYPPSGGSIGAGSANIPDVLSAGETHAYSSVNATEYLASGTMTAAQVLALGNANYLQLNTNTQQVVTGVVEFDNAPQSSSFVVWGPKAYMYVGATQSMTINVATSTIGSFNLGNVTWAQLQNNAPTGTAGDNWFCNNCTVTSGSTTVTGVMLFWNPQYGSNGGWDYAARVMGATFSHP